MRAAATTDILTLQGLRDSLARRARCRGRLPDPARAAEVTRPLPSCSTRTSASAAVLSSTCGAFATVSRSPSTSSPGRHHDRAEIRFPAGTTRQAFSGTASPALLRLRLTAPNRAPSAFRRWRALALQPRALLTALAPAALPNPANLPRSPGHDRTVTLRCGFSCSSCSSRATFGRISCSPRCAVPAPPPRTRG